MIAEAKSKHSKMNTSMWKLMRNPRVLLVLLAFCEKNIFRYMMLVVSMVPIVGVVSEFVLPVLYVLLIISCINEKTKVGLTEIGVVAFMTTAIVFSCLIYPENTEYITDSNNFWNTIFPCLRWFIVGLAILPDKDLMDLLGVVSCIAILLETAFLIVYMIPRGLVGHDDMNRAYQILPNAMLAFNYAFDSKKLWAWASSICSVIYLLSLGTRGPFLILLLYFVIKLFMTMWVNKRKRNLMLGACGFTFAVFAIPGMFDGLINMLVSLLSKLGLSTRILELLQEGTVISYTSGRDEIFEKAFEKVAEHPIRGYGVYGEWPWTGWNVHNLYIELIVHFGIILGPILLIWMLNMVFKAIKTPNSCSKDLIVIFFCFVFVRGFFGGSYLMFGTFFLLGLCIKERQRMKLKLSNTIPPEI